MSMVQNIIGLPLTEGFVAGWSSVLMEGLPSPHSKDLTGAFPASVVKVPGGLKQPTN